jgi:hypothetical protein
VVSVWLLIKPVSWHSPRERINPCLKGTDGEEHTVGEPLIHCFDGAQLVLAFVERTALADSANGTKAGHAREQSNC